MFVNGMSRDGDMQGLGLVLGESLRNSLTRDICTGVKIDSYDSEWQKDHGYCLERNAASFEVKMFHVQLDIDSTHF